MENKLSMISVLFEGKKETKEQVQGLKKGLTMADNLAAYAKIFGVDSKVVASAISKDLSVLEKEISTISKRVIKNSDPDALKSFTTQIPDKLKLASKELAIKRLWEATQQGKKTLTKAEVESIINSTKSETKIIWNDAKSASNASSKGGAGAGGKGKPSGSGGISSWFSKWFSGGKNKPRVTVNTNKTGEWLSKRWKNFSTVRKILTITSLAALGYVGYTVYDYIQAFLGIDPLPDLDDQDVPESVKDWKKCIVDAFEGENAPPADVDDNGVYLQISVNEFGGKQTGGWVRFYSDYKVTTKSGETGKWNCNQSAIKNINEQDDSAMEMDNDVENMIDLLDFPVSGSDLKSAHDLLTKYLNNGKGQSFLNLYQRSGFGGGDLRKTLNFVKTPFSTTSTRLKDEMLSMITKIQSGQDVKNTEGTKSDKESGGSSNVSHLTVTWDDGKTSDGGSGGGIKFSPCNDFPMSLGCISEKIRDIQRCLNPTANLVEDGKFGPLTLDAMQDKSLFAGSPAGDKVITKEVYDNIMKNCKKGDEPTNTVSREKVEPVDVKPKGVELIPITTLNADEMKKKFGEDLLKQANKTINGEVVMDIIREKVRFTLGGKYVLNMDEELTEDQLKSINRWMAGLGYSLDKKKETLEKNRYVWVAKDRDSRRIARKQNQIDRIKSNNEE